MFLLRRLVARALSMASTAQVMPNGIPITPFMHLQMQFPRQYNPWRQTKKKHHRPKRR